MRKSIVFVVLSLLLFSCNPKKSNMEKTNREGEIRTSRGYSTDPNYRPTISSHGKYHTIDGKARQNQFQGSLEQKQQLEMLDEYERTHPEY